MSIRKFVAFLCVVALLSAAMAPSAAGPLWAVLIPILLFVSLVAAVFYDCLPDERKTPVSPLLAVSGSRAPPCLASLI